MEEFKFYGVVLQSQQGSDLEMTLNLEQGQQFIWNGVAETGLLWYVIQPLSLQCHGFGLKWSACEKG